MSWYAGDPEYQLIDYDCRLLISPTSVSKNWHIGRFRLSPASVIIDSGSFHYIDAEENKLTKTQKEVFEDQIRILNGFKPALICHLDFAIPRCGMPERKMKERIEITIENAEKFYDICLRNENRLMGIEPLAVIQGYDVRTVLYCAKRLKKIGFKKFGIGSIARLSRINRTEILGRIAKVLTVVKDLHIFGVSSIEIMKQLEQLNISSIDSTTPIKEAVYAGIFYSKPFRRFKIGTEHFKNCWSKKYGYAKVITKPLPCKCPICNGIGSWVLMLRGRKLWNNLRAMHNYYHFKKELFGTVRSRKNMNIFASLNDYLNRYEVQSREENEVFYSRVE